MIMGHRITLDIKVPFSFLIKFLKMHAEIHFKFLRCFKNCLNIRISKVWLYFQYEHTDLN